MRERHFEQTLRRRACCRSRCAFTPPNGMRGSAVGTMRSLMSTKPVFRCARRGREARRVRRHGRKSTRPSAKIGRMDLVEPRLVRRERCRVASCVSAGDARARILPNHPAIDCSTTRRRGAMHVCPIVQSVRRISARERPDRDRHLRKRSPHLAPESSMTAGVLVAARWARTSRPFSDEPVKITLSTPSRDGVVRRPRRSRAAS